MTGCAALHASRLMALGSLGVAVGGAKGEPGGVFGCAIFCDNLDRTFRWFRGERRVSKAFLMVLGVYARALARVTDVFLL